MGGGGGMPRVLREPSESHAAVDAMRAAGKRIGFVPTMGALHAGHTSLMERARRECDALVVSIYVNPLQFGPNEDFAQYPRPVEDDLATCEQYGVDLVLHLDEGAMNPPGYATFVEVEGVSAPLEGHRRPGHFRGVATVVAKLFHLAKPHRAYFGQKDAQQAVVVDKMARELNVDVDIVCCPIVREADGLALSSRNVYLSAEERAQAPALYEGLQAALRCYDAGERRCAALCDAVRAVLVQRAPDLRLDYVAACEPSTFEPLAPEASVGERAVLAVAAFLGQTRLIDNQMLPAGAPLLGH